MIKIKGKFDSIPEVWADRNLPLEITLNEEGKQEKKTYYLIKTRMGRLLLNKKV